MSKYSIQNALNKASVYIDRRIEDGSKLAITLPHATHILIVAISAYMIAYKIKKKTQDTTIDVDKAFVCGLLHDIGRYIVDEKVAKYPHTIAGYDRCKKLKIPAVANKAGADEYPDYSPAQLDFVNKTMSGLKRSFYDDLIMLVDLHCRGDQILPIKDRLAKNQKFYNIQANAYCKKYLDLYSDFTKKYGVDIYKICRFVSEHKERLFKQLLPYCHGWLRYVCGDKTVANTCVTSKQLESLQTYLLQNQNSSTR